MENQGLRMEKQSGTLCLEAYLNQDWEEYGDSIVCEQLDSLEYRKWVSEHWDEEMARRRRNYTKPHTRREENITWIRSPLWQFERREYECMTEDYRKVYEGKMGRD